MENRKLKSKIENYVPETGQNVTKRCNEYIDILEPQSVS